VVKSGEVLIVDDALLKENSAKLEVDSPDHRLNARGLLLPRGGAFELY
jgi:hypothetical protein